MLIDCETCVMRDIACDDCVVSVMLELTERPIEVDASERRALEVLAGGGLVPRLRLSPPTTPLDRAAGDG